MFRKKNLTEQSMVRKLVRKEIEVNKQSCTIVIEDVPFSEVNGTEVMVDKPQFNKIISDISRSLETYNTTTYKLPKTIHLSQKDYKTLLTGSDDATETEDTSFVELHQPKVRLSDVYITEKMKSQLETSITISKHRDVLFNEWGLDHRGDQGSSIVLNFYGPPGTGKSRLAEAVAGELNQKLLLVNYADLESKYVGETPKNIKKAFQMASEQEAVLVFDEADSFLGKRLTNISQSADYGVNITRSVMLIELEKFSGVVIFTTNLIENYDEAFRRRILANIPFSLPDLKGRKAIWELHLKDKVPRSKEVSSAILAEKYPKLSGADIKDMLLYAAVLCLQKSEIELTINHFDEAYRYIRNRYDGYSMDNVNITHEKISEEQYQKEVESC